MNARCHSAWPRQALSYKSTFRGKSAHDGSELASRAALTRQIGIWAAGAASG